MEKDFQNRVVVRVRVRVFKRVTGGVCSNYLGVTLLSFLGKFLDSVLAVEQRTSTLALQD